MVRFPLAYALAVLFCTALFFSCTSDLELPPPPSQLEDTSSSSDTKEFPPDEASSSSEAKIKPPPMSQPSVQSSSSESGIVEPSSSQTATQFSSSSIASSNLNSSSSQSTQNNSSSSTQATTQSSSSLEQANNEPRLEGTCVWSENPATMARGAVPSGVSIVDTDNVCGNKKSIVYKYDEGFETWPANGIVKAGIYDDVEATLNCPAYSKPVAVPCPPLIVDEHSDYQMICNGSQLSSTICNKIEQKVKSDECIDVEINWTNTAFHPNITMTCEGQFSGANASSMITLKVGSKPVVSKSGDYYVSVSTAIINNIPVGVTKVSGICVSYTTTGSNPDVRCRLGNN
jgi:hypothetical protein